MLSAEQVFKKYNDDDDDGSQTSLPSLEKPRTNNIHSFIYSSLYHLPYSLSIIHTIHIHVFSEKHSQRRAMDFLFCSSVIYSMMKFF